MIYHYTIIMLVLASIASLFHVSMCSTYSNLIHVKIEKLLYKIILVSYLKKKYSFIKLLYFV
jgi:hypothetical protein